MRHFRGNTLKLRDLAACRAKFRSHFSAEGRLLAYRVFKNKMNLARTLFSETIYFSRDILPLRAVPAFILSAEPPHRTIFDKYLGKYGQITRAKSSIGLPPTGHSRCQAPSDPGEQGFECHIDCAGLRDPPVE